MRMMMRVCDVPSAVCFNIYARVRGVLEAKKSLILIGEKSCLRQK